VLKVGRAGGAMICDVGRARPVAVARGGDGCCAATCEPGRPRDSMEDRGEGGGALDSDLWSASGVALALMIDDLFPAIDVPAVTLSALPMLRVWTWLTLVLVVRDGIAGPPARGDCGSLVETARCRPDEDMAGCEGVEGTSPVNAASDCALAASKSASVSSSTCFNSSFAFEVLVLVLAYALAPRGGIIEVGRESLEHGGGMTFLSSSIPLLTPNSPELRVLS